jgi:hypothetical protein
MKRVAATVLFLTVAVFGADDKGSAVSRWLNFEAAPEGKEAKGLLEFEVLDTAQRIDESTLHTLYLVRAIVVRSTVDEIAPGTRFEAGFDRFYSIFWPRDSHPLKKQDHVLLAVSDSKGAITCIVKEIKGLTRR